MLCSVGFEVVQRSSVSLFSALSRYVFDSAGNGSSAAA